MGSGGKALHAVGVAALEPPLVYCVLDDGQLIACLQSKLVVILGAVVELGRCRLAGALERAEKANPRKSGKCIAQRSLNKGRNIYLLRILREKRKLKLRPKRRGKHEMPTIDSIP